MTATAQPSTLRPFIMALRTLGFERDFDSRAGGARIVQFKRAFGQRDVEVQLFDDGRHRASHMVFSDPERFRGLMDTLPTDFSDGAGLLDAIICEASRPDNAKAAAQTARPTRDQLVEIIMRETTDRITADGSPIGAPNVLVQGCRYVRGHQPGYENPEEAARTFAGFIADAVLTAFAGVE